MSYTEYGSGQPVQDVAVRGKADGDNSVTPTISASSIYASGDQLGGIMTISNAVRNLGGTGLLKGITVIDGDNQGAKIDVLIFKSSPTVSSSDNAAIDIAASELVSKLLCRVTIDTTDYTTVKAATNAEATKECSRSIEAASDSRDLYAVAVVRGTPTYTTTSALTFKFDILQD